MVAVEVCDDPGYMRDELEPEEESRAEDIARAIARSSEVSNTWDLTFSRRRILRSCWWKLNLVEGRDLGALTERGNSSTLT